MPETSLLETSDTLGKVGISTKRFRSKYMLPSGIILGTLNDLFGEATTENTKTVDVTSSSGRTFTVGRYASRPEYQNGVVSYSPVLNYLEQFPDGDHSQEGYIVFGALETSDTNWNFCKRINPNNDKQTQFVLKGETWLPRNAVVERIVEHERLVDFGAVILEHCQRSAALTTNISDYSVFKIIG